MLIFADMVLLGGIGILAIDIHKTGSGSYQRRAQRYVSNKANQNWSFLPLERVLGIYIMRALIWCAISRHRFRVLISERLLRLKMLHRCWTCNLPLCHYYYCLKTIISLCLILKYCATNPSWRMPSITHGTWITVCIAHNLVFISIFLS